MNARRRFHVLDALILVGFTAVGLAWSVAFERSREAVRLEFQAVIITSPAAIPAPNPAPWPLWWDNRAAESAQVGSRHMTFFLLVWTLALPVLRLRNLRPPLRRLVSRWWRPLAASTHVDCVSRFATKNTEWSGRLCPPSRLLLLSSLSKTRAPGLACRRGRRFRPDSRASGPAARPFRNGR